MTEKSVRSLTLFSFYSQCFRIISYLCKVTNKKHKYNEKVSIFNHLNSLFYKLF